MLLAYTAEVERNGRKPVEDGAAAMPLQMRPDVLRTLGGGGLTGEGAPPPLSGAGPAPRWHSSFIKFYRMRICKM